MPHHVSIVHEMDHKSAEHRVSLRFWLAAAIVGVNALAGVGFAIGTVVSAPSVVGWHFADRAAALLVTVLIVVAFRHRAGLLVVGWVLVGVQVVDALVGIGSRAAPTAIGPVILALATAGALIWLARTPSTRSDQPVAGPPGSHSEEAAA
jgi:hypothetical protein